MENVLTCSANREGLPAPDEACFDLYGLLAKFEQQFDAVAKTHGLFLGVNVYKDTPRYFLGDYLRVNDILTNLVRYIISHLQDGGIFLNVYSSPLDQGYYRLDLIFTDSGIGIPEDQLNKIFQPEYQKTVSGHIYKNTPSLYRAKLITSLMGGDVSVKTTFGWGTRYSAYILMKCGVTTPYRYYN